MKRNISIFAACIVFLMIILGILYGSYLREHVTPVPAGTVGNTAGNAYNGGLMCEYNGIIYFSNPYDEGTLYSMSMDGTKIKKIIDANVSYINAGGKYLFFFQKQASGAAGLGYARTLQGIYRSTLDGKNVTCLERCLIFNLQLVGNNIYYLTSGDKGTQFLKLGIDKKNREVLETTGINFACAQEDSSIYYNGDDTNHYLYRYSTASDSSSTIYKGNLWFPIYDNGYIYYLDLDNDYRLSRYSITADTVEVLTHERVDCYNLAGGYLFYQKNSKKEPALKKMSLDGQNVETIMEGNYTHLLVAGNYLYFQAFGSDIPIYRMPLTSNVVSSFSEAQEAALKYIK